MINQAMFRAAHYVAAEINQKGDSYSVTFTLCLKALYKKLPSMKADADRTGRSILGFISDASREMLVKARKAIREIQQAAPTAKAASWSSRRVVPVVVAEREGLNRGKSWFCSERDIQTKGACPSWEGEAICYVYA
ncbi:hypothetical protein [Vreelandella titanicae]|uniref:hypothetical protein n=1 Tax=Vreelandella titanicae TaxID=664683 RepID=UPI0038118ACA